MVQGVCHFSLGTTGLSAVCMYNVHYANMQINKATRNKVASRNGDLSDSHFRYG